MESKYPADICADAQIHQGDIFLKIPFYERYKENKGAFELAILEFPLALILTQECDLEQNLNERKKCNVKTEAKFLHDKYLVSLLCAPVYNAQHLFLGEHLSFLDIQSTKKGKEQKNYIMSNRDPRYHYIEFEDSTRLVPSVIDFKHYFSVSLEILEAKIENRICSVKPIYRELISQRFANYLSRIGLPN